MLVIENFAEAVTFWEKSNEIRANSIKSDYSHFSELMERIHCFSELKQNWDSYNADAIAFSSIEIAKKLLTNLYERNLTDPVFQVSVFPMRNGGIQFEIDKANDSCEIEINSDETLALITFDVEVNIPKLQKDL
jgi:hypothetical protein